jgi:hypothetical protein
MPIYQTCNSEIFKVSLIIGRMFKTNLLRAKDNTKPDMAVVIVRGVEIADSTNDSGFLVYSSQS